MFTSKYKGRKAVDAIISLCLLWLFSISTAMANSSEPLECLIEAFSLVEVSSSEIGVLASVNVREADLVKKGDIVAALRTDVERAALDVSAARAQAESEIELLRRDYQFNLRKRDRVDELQHEQAVSIQDLDEVRTAQDAAWLRLQVATERQRAAQLEAKRDELALARRTVESPIDGVVVQKHKSAGEYVDGNPIVQIAQLDPLLIRVVVSMDMFGQIQPGMHATIVPELPIKGPFVATVTSIDPIMDAATGTIGIRLSLPNPKHRLPAGQRCSLVLHPQDADSADAVSGSKSETIADIQDDQQQPDSDLSLQLGAASSSESPTATALTADPVVHERALGDMQHAKMSVSEAKQLLPAGKECLSIGPLKENDAVDTVTAVLGESDINFTRRYESVEAENGPWTVVSAHGFLDVIELNEKHKLAGLTDTHWLKSGQWKGRVSYGHYRNLPNAQNRLNHVRKQGFDASLVSHASNESVLWLDLVDVENGSKHKALMSSIQAYYPKLQEVPSDCPQLVSR
ncbi:MAG: efflux RND transporter periplasmic adaptor subunit [Granulosicoccus sp.]